MDADYDRVWIDLDRCSVDALDILSDGIPSADAQRTGEFLEGFDIPGEEGFEDWLREQRRMLAERLEGLPAAPARPAQRPEASAESFRQKPSIAMLPTAASAEDSALAEAATRLSDEVVDRLSRVRWLSVVGPGTVVAIRNGLADRNTIGAAVGARYLLELQLLRIGGRATLAATLAESSSWRTILSQRAELGPDVESSIAEAARDLVAAIDAQVETAEQDRVLQKPLQSLAGSELVWRARWHLDRLTRADAAVAEELINRVRAEAPEWAEALIQAGFCRAWSIWTGRRSAGDIQQLRRLGLRAVAADRFDARGHLLIGMADTWLRRPDRARLALEEAISLNPSLCQAYMQLGSAHYLAGNPRAALAPMNTALRLNPQDAQIFCVLAERGMVHCMLAEWDRAVEFAELALLRKPGYWYAHIIKINALLRVGDLAAARRARADLSSSSPAFSESHIDWLPFVDNRWPQFLKEGLRQSEED
ncbi:MAG: hypothetical protein M3Q08_01825 [Pseudomonadota bacterium]|nr:hypothetical protein [Pseudomonadota bacterium]